MNSLRTILLIILTLAVVALCIDLAVEAHRIEAAANRVADKIEANVEKLNPLPSLFKRP